MLKTMRTVLISKSIADQINDKQKLLSYPGVTRNDDEDYATVMFLTQAGVFRITVSSANITDAKDVSKIYNNFMREVLKKYKFGMNLCFTASWLIDPIARLVIINNLPYNIWTEPLFRSFLEDKPSEDTLRFLSIIPETYIVYGIIEEIVTNSSHPFHNVLLDPDTWYQGILDPILVANIVQANHDVPFFGSVYRMNQILINYESEYKLSQYYDARYKTYMARYAAYKVKEAAKKLVYAATPIILEFIRDPPGVLLRRLGEIFKSDPNAYIHYHPLYWPKAIVTWGSRNETIGKINRLAFKYLVKTFISNPQSSALHKIIETRSKALDEAERIITKMLENPDNLIESLINNPEEIDMIKRDANKFIDSYQTLSEALLSGLMAANNWNSESAQNRLFEHYQNKIIQDRYNFIYVLSALPLSEVKESLDKIKQARRVYQDLKLEADRVEIYGADYKINEILTNMAEYTDLRGIIPNYSDEYGYADPPPTTYDPRVQFLDEQIEQILTNILPSKSADQIEEVKRLIDSDQLEYIDRYLFNLDTERKASIQKLIKFHEIQGFISNVNLAAIDVNNLNMTQTKAILDIMRETINNYKSSDRPDRKETLESYLTKATEIFNILDGNETILKVYSNYYRKVEGLPKIDDITDLVGEFKVRDPFDNDDTAKQVAAVKTIHSINDYVSAQIEQFRMIVDGFNPEDEDKINNLNQVIAELIQVVANIRDLDDREAMVTFMNTYAKFDEIVQSASRLLNHPEFLNSETRQIIENIEKTRATYYPYVQAYNDKYRNGLPINPGLSTNQLPLDKLDEPLNRHLNELANIDSGKLARFIAKKLNLTASIPEIVNKLNSLPNPEEKVTYFSELIESQLDRETAIHFKSVFEKNGIDRAMSFIKAKTKTNVPVDAGLDLMEKLILNQRVDEKLKEHPYFKEIRDDLIQQMEQKNQQTIREARERIAKFNQDQDQEVFRLIVNIPPKLNNITYDPYLFGTKRSTWRNITNEYSSLQDYTLTSKGLIRKLDDSLELLNQRLVTNNEELSKVDAKDMLQILEDWKDNDPLNASREFNLLKNRLIYLSNNSSLNDPVDLDDNVIIRLGLPSQVYGIDLEQTINDLNQKLTERHKFKLDLTEQTQIREILNQKQTNELIKSEIENYTYKLRENVKIDVYKNEKSILNGRFGGAAWDLLVKKVKGYIENGIILEDYLNEVEPSPEFILAGKLFEAELLSKDPKVEEIIKNLSEKKVQTNELFSILSNANKTNLNELKRIIRVINTDLKSKNLTDKERSDLNQVKTILESLFGWNASVGNVLNLSNISSEKALSYLDQIYGKILVNSEYGQDAIKYMRDRFLEKGTLMKYLGLSNEDEAYNYKSIITTSNIGPVIQFGRNFAFFALVRYFYDKVPYISGISESIMNLTINFSSFLAKEPNKQKYRKSSAFTILNDLIVNCSSTDPTLFKLQIKHQVALKTKTNKAKSWFKPENKLHDKFITIVYPDSSVIKTNKEDLDTILDKIFKNYDNVYLKFENGSFDPSTLYFRIPSKSPDIYLVTERDRLILRSINPNSFVNVTYESSGSYVALSLVLELQGNTDKDVLERYNQEIKQKYSKLVSIHVGMNFLIN